LISLIGLDATKVYDKPLSENSAIFCLGHRKEDERLKVSEDIAALGLNMFRAAPSEISMFAVPDAHQLGYGEYIANLPAFIYSYVFSSKITAHDSTYYVEPADLEEKDISLMPLNPPETFLTFQTKLDAETTAGVIQFYDATQISGVGQPGFVWQPKNWDLIPKLQKYRPTKICNVPRTFANPQALLYSKRIVALLSALFHLHKYPAYTDLDHFNNLEGIYKIEQTLDNDGMTIDSIEDLREHEDREVCTFPVTRQNGRKHRMTIDMSYDRTTRSTVAPWLNHLSFIDNLPQADGLYCPFYDALAKDDTKTVPDFFERYLVKSLGGSLEDAIFEARSLRGEWGVLASTSFGRQVTHMVAILDLALQGQCRAVPVFRNGNLQGMLLSGAGYTIDVGREGFRPTSRANLTMAIPHAGLHEAAISKIAQKVPLAVRETIKSASTMWELHCLLIESRIAETDKATVVEAAKNLEFGERSWPVNLLTMEQAFTLIRLPMPLVIENNLPIHWSKILCVDKTELVWSCFGGMAPSFRVPGGKRFKLSEEMTYELPSGTRGREATMAKLVRIAVFDKPLELAIRDIRSVMEDQSIDNPLGMSRVKRSESSHNKAFIGEDGTKLLGLLREFVGLDKLAGGSKTKRTDDDEGSVLKKRRGMDY
jgi:hypothetical protein